MGSGMLTIRRATTRDLGAITEIYNEAILHTDATFDTKPKTLEEQKSWFDSHDQKHPILIAEQDGLVAGWASLSKWSDLMRILRHRRSLAVRQTGTSRKRYREKALAGSCRRRTGDWSSHGDCPNRGR